MINSSSVNSGEFQMPKEILVATNNKGKFKEISALLASVGISAVAASEFNFVEPEETGATFEENSILKAKYYGQKTNLVALADDSGFCVVDLDNKPGVHSARFALNEKGEKDFGAAFGKIYAELQQKNITVPALDEANMANMPRAFFVCNLSLFDPKTGFIKSFEGRVDGFVINPPRGDQGFGFDPIFVMNNTNKTFGEITPEEKDQISHRGIAFKKMLKWLSE